jgi:hypothetical protein
VSLPVLQVVPRRTADRVVDAALLDDADLETARLLLEGSPLAETALLVRGADQHLLFAPGGLLERVPVGEPLYCLGPGPLYLPLGQGLEPHVPADGRRQLFGADERTAVILLPRRGLLFDLERREPVWHLWVGGLPPIDLAQLPAERMAELQALEPAEPVEPSGPAGPARPSRRWLDRFRRARPMDEDWKDKAMRLELAGDLARAAELHREHGSPLQAARLFERAAHA